MHHVILGAGPAGVTAAETLRQMRPNDEITLISGEGEAPYSRMAIPYLLHGQIDEGGTHLRQTPGHFDTLGINIREARAGGIDTRAKALFVSGSEDIAYDRLLLATGASPIIPPLEGATLPGVHPCWTLEDARKIVERAEPGAPVVLVGAGFIGSIILEALVGRGADLTVVELAPRMVARMMDETAGGMLARWCETKGVRVLTGAKVERI
ncbi:MAG: FAD-dependent oxidoreductase, partial [Pseudomonadota bacterium]